MSSTTTVKLLGENKYVFMTERGREREGETETDRERERRADVLRRMCQNWSEHRIF